MLIKKIHLVFGCLLLLSACENLERDNLLDPKNPDSERQRVVFVEAFVNDGARYSSFALGALDSLAADFPSDQVVIVEHHLQSTNYADVYALQESNDRYSSLVGSNRGIPDVFFNGTMSRAQGASSVHTALVRYRNAINAELSRVAHFTIEARKNISSAGIDLEVTLARLGNERFSEFAVLAIVWENVGTAGHRHVVRKVFPPEDFSSVAAGEIKSLHFTGSLPATSNAARLQAAVIIERNTSLGREILQAALAE